MNLYETISMAGLLTYPSTGLTFGYIVLVQLARYSLSRWPAQAQSQYKGIAARIGA